MFGISIGGVDDGADENFIKLQQGVQEGKLGGVSLCSRKELLSILWNGGMVFASQLRVEY